MPNFDTVSKKTLRASFDNSMRDVHSVEGCVSIACRLSSKSSVLAPSMHAMKTKFVRGVRDEGIVAAARSDRSPACWSC